MTAQPVGPSALATRDAEDALSYYLEEDAEAAALGFIDALEQAYVHIGRHPASNSTRYAHELDLPELRAWHLRRYPYIVFYVEQLAHIDIRRVLHGQSNIPAWLRRE